MSEIDTIVKSIKDNYMNSYYTTMINDINKEGNKKRDISKLSIDIYSKLGCNYYLYKLDDNYMIFKINGIYILIEYIYLYLIDSKFIITIFHSINELNKYLDK